MKPVLLVFYVFTGLLATVVILGALELNGRHTFAEGAFLAWSLVITSAGSILSAIAVFLDD